MARNNRRRDSTGLLALAALALGGFYLLGRNGGSGGGEQTFSIRLMDDRQSGSEGRTQGPVREGSNYGTPSAGATPSEAQDSRETTAPGGDAESTATTRYEAAKQTSSETGGGVSQNTVTSGGLTQDDDESDMTDDPNTRFEKAQHSTETTGGGAGNRRFTQG